MRPASDALPRSASAPAAAAFSPDGRDVFDARNDQEVPEVPARNSAEPDSVRAHERTIPRERSPEHAIERQQERMIVRETISTAAMAVLRGGDGDRRGMAQTPQAPSPPAIHVTIGRVDVQAAQAPQPPRPRAAAPQQPKLSLEDYLKRRGRRAP